MPRKDLHVTLGGVTIKPARALGAWAAFKKNCGRSYGHAFGGLVLTRRWEDLNVRMTKSAEYRGGNVQEQARRILRSPDWGKCAVAFTCICTIAKPKYDLRSMPFANRRRPSHAALKLKGRRSEATSALAGRRLSDMHQALI